MTYNTSAAHVPKVRLVTGHTPMSETTGWPDPSIGAHGAGPATHGYVGDAPTAQVAQQPPATWTWRWWMVLAPLAHILSAVSTPRRLRAMRPLRVSVAVRLYAGLLGCVRAAWLALGLDGDDIRVVLGFLIVLMAVVFVSVTVGLSVGLAFRFYHLGLGA